MEISPERAKDLAVRAALVFRPRAPIETQELLAGRSNHRMTLVDAIGQPGLHIVIYGERAVGKTSLANTVRPLIQVLDSEADGQPEKRLVIKINAHNGDNFSSIWQKLLDEITWQDDRATIGFMPEKRRIPILQALSFEVGTHSLNIDNVRRIVSHMPGAVFIIDEFDRAAPGASQNFTDLIKALSDFAVDCTIILVGVSDTIDTLVSDHASISRSLVQIFLPRMEASELHEILRKAEDFLGVEIADEAADLIVNISQGLPHYTHLLGLHAVRIAARDDRSHIEIGDVFHALKQAGQQAQQSVKQQHSRATSSAHKDALYRHVLLACAVASARASDTLGYFSPSSIVEPLDEILGRPVQIATFTNHLGEFSQEKRGSVLQRIGATRSYRFRFRDPLLVPFVFMDAIETKLIPELSLEGLIGAEF